MIRYRSDSTVPGVKPPGSIESEKASRPIGDDGTRPAAAATDGVASPVGTCEADVRSRPHRGHADASATSAPQLGQRTRPKSYRGRAIPAARGYIFFSAAAFFVTLPSIMEPQVFPSSEVSNLKSYPVGEVSVMV